MVPPTSVRTTSEVKERNWGSLFQALATARTRRRVVRKNSIMATPPNSEDNASTGHRTPCYLMRKPYSPKCLEVVFSEVQGVLRYSKLRSASTTDNKDVRAGTEQTRLRFYAPYSL